MDTQMFRWMEMASGMAKTSRWSTAANGAAPREAWYHGPRLGRTELTDDVLNELRRTFWSGVEVKFDETLTINGVPLLRVTLPRQFLPHFEADETTFYLYKAIAPNVVVDFGKLWGGPLAETILRASPMTMNGDVRGVVAIDETPAPRGVIRAEQARAEALRQDPVTTEVEMIPERPPPRIVERLRGVDHSHEPHEYHAVRPSNPTCIPEADAVPDAPSSGAIESALAIFGGNGDANDDVPPVRSRSSTPPVAEDEQVVLDRSPVDYGYVAIMSSLVAFVLIFLCFAAWTLLSLS